MGMTLHPERLLPARSLLLPQSGRRTLWWARIVCLSAFGPYVTGSARTEQIAVFASLAAIAVTGWPRMTRAPFAPAPFLLAWGALCAVMTVSTVFRPADPMFYGLQPPSHALSALLLPVALMVVTWYWTLSADPVSLTGAVAPLVTGALCVNTVIEVAQVSAGKAAVVSFLPHFWGAVPSAGSVALMAAQNGRYTGIFDQPAEAGIAYGVALLCLIWLARRRAWHPAVVTCAAVLVCAGGVLTLSKVFLLVAAPVAVVTVLRGPSRVRAAAVTAAASGAVWLAGSAGALPAWNLGGAAFASLAHPGSSLAAQYTAGRYGSSGTLGAPAADVLRTDPLAGFGAGGLNVAYDSLWLEVLAVAGVLGVVLAVVMLALLALRWSRLGGSLWLPEWHLAGGVLALAAGASLGIPSLTANRASTLLWLILGVLIAARVPDRRGRAALSPRRG
jgi:hypothetical protein